MKRTRLSKRLVTQLSGYDVFISYRHLEARKYAEELYKQLDQRGLYVFLDESDEDSGTSIEKFIKIACTARALVVIVSPEVYSSKNVHDEVKAYFKKRIDQWYRRPFSRIISINVDQALSNAPSEPKEWKRLIDYVYEPETNEALYKAIPSNEVVEGIAKSSGFMRTWALFIAITGFIVLLISVGIGGSLLFLYNLQKQITTATNQLDISKDHLTLLDEKNNSLTNKNQDLSNKVEKGQNELNKTRGDLLRTEVDLSSKQKESIIILDSLNRQRLFSQSETNKANLNYLQVKIRDNYLKDDYKSALKNLEELDMYQVDEEKRVNFYLEGLEVCINKNNFIEGAILLSKIKAKFYNIFPEKFNKAHVKFLFSEVRNLLKNYDPNKINGIDYTNSRIGCILQKIYSYGTYKDSVLNFIKSEYYLPIHSHTYLSDACSSLLSVDGTYVSYINKDSVVVMKIDGTKCVSMKNLSGKCDDPYPKVYFPAFDKDYFRVVTRTVTGAQQFYNPEIKKRAYTFETFVNCKLESSSEVSDYMPSNSYNNENKETYYMKYIIPSETYYPSGEDTENYYYNKAFQNKTIKKLILSKKLQKKVNFNIKDFTSIEAVYPASKFLTILTGKSLKCKNGGITFLVDKNFNYLATLNYFNNIIISTDYKYLFDESLQRLWVTNPDTIFEEIDWKNALSKQDKIKYGIDFEN